MDDFLDADLGTCGDVGVAEGFELMRGTIERNGDLTGLLAVAWNAEIDVGRESDGLLNTECVVAVEFHHLEEQEGDERHEDEAHDGSQQSKQDVVGDVVPAEHACPAETKNETDD